MKQELDREISTLGSYLKLCQGNYFHLALLPLDHLKNCKLK